MKYFINVENGYINAVSTEHGQTEITEAEYSTIVLVIRNKPTAPSGYDYRLKTDLTWELYELPPLPEDDATEEDYQNQLERLGVDV